MLTFADRLDHGTRKPAKSPIRRRRPTQERAHATVDAILEAVIRLLRRGDMSEITTNTIAETAGVSISSVYQYFPNIRAIFVALQERHINQVDRVLQQRISESGDVIPNSRHCWILKFRTGPIERGNSRSDCMSFSGGRLLRTQRLARFITVKKNRRAFAARHIGAFFIGPFAHHGVSCLSNGGIETQNANPPAYNT